MPETLPTNATRIAVVIPAYNASAYIAETIESVLNQSRLADEIVVVNDGSTDNTAEIANGINPAVTVIHQNNAGQGKARQRGAEATSADFLLFLDADDILHASALEKLSAALAGNPAAGAAYCLAEIWSPDGIIQLQPDNLSRPDGENLWSALLCRNFIRTSGCVLIRRTALNEAGGWDCHARLQGSEDWELWLRLSEKFSFVLVAEPLLRYRSQAGFSKKFRHRMFKGMFNMYRKQRCRWGHDRRRKLAIDAAEWTNCKSVIAETQNYVRSACSRGLILKAVSRLFAVVPMVMLPIINQGFNSVMSRMVRRQGVV